MSYNNIRIDLSNDLQFGHDSGHRGGISHRNLSLHMPLNPHIHLHVNGTTFKTAYKLCNSCTHLQGSQKPVGDRGSLPQCPILWIQWVKTYTTPSLHDGKEVSITTYPIRISIGIRTVHLQHFKKTYWKPWSRSVFTLSGSGNTACTGGCMLIEMYSLKRMPNWRSSSSVHLPSSYSGESGESFWCISPSVRRPASAYLLYIVSIM